MVTTRSAARARDGAKRRAVLGLKLTGKNERRARRQLKSWQWIKRDQTRHLGAEHGSSFDPFIASATVKQRQAQDALNHSAILVSQAMLEARQRSARRKTTRRKRSRTSRRR